MLDQAAETLPDLAQFEEDMVELLESGKVKRTGNYHKDFLAAYNTAKKRDGKLSNEQRMEKSMRRIYDRKTGGK